MSPNIQPALTECQTIDEVFAWLDYKCGDKANHGEDSHWNTGYARQAFDRIKVLSRAHLAPAPAVPFYETHHAAVAKEFLDWLFPDEELKTDAERLQKASHSTNLASLLLQRFPAHPTVPAPVNTAQPAGSKAQRVEDYEWQMHQIEQHGGTVPDHMYDHLEELKALPDGEAALTQPVNTGPSGELAKYIEALTIRPMSEAPKGPTIMAIYHGDQCPVRWNGNSWTDQDGVPGWQDYHFQGFFDLRKLDGLLIVPAALAPGADKAPPSKPTEMLNDMDKSEAFKASLAEHGEVYANLPDKVQPTAEALTREVFAVYCAGFSGSGEYCADPEESHAVAAAIIQRALEASAHLAAAPGSITPKQCMEILLDKVHSQRDANGEMWKGTTGDWYIHHISRATAPAQPDTLIREALEGLLGTFNSAVEFISKLPSDCMGVRAGEAGPEGEPGWNIVDEFLHYAKQAKETAETALAAAPGKREGEVKG